MEEGLKDTANTETVISYGRTFGVTNPDGRTKRAVWIGIQPLAFHKNRLRTHLKYKLHGKVSEDAGREDKGGGFDEKMLSVALYKITDIIYAHSNKERGDIEPIPEMTNCGAASLNIIPGDMSGVPMAMRDPRDLSKHVPVPWILPLIYGTEMGDGTPFTYIQTLVNNEHNVYVPVWSMSDSPNDMMKALMEAASVCARVAYTTGFDMTKASLPTVILRKPSDYTETLEEAATLTEKYPDKKYMFSYVWSFSNARTTRRELTPKQMAMAELVYVKDAFEAPPKK